jgi:hypothetical protein
MLQLRNIFTVALLVILVTGCTTSLKVTKLNDDTNIDINGVIYYLPKSSFQIAVKRVLNECPYVYKDKIFIKFTNSVEVAYSTVSDLDNAYVIDYNSLSAASKDYDLEINLYGNGTLKSINSSSSDKTGEIISSVAKSLAVLALINTTGGAALVPASVPEAEPGILEKEKEEPLLIQLCSDDVLNALANQETATKNAKKANVKLAAKLAELKKLVTTIDAIGVKKTSPAYKKKLKELAVLHEDSEAKNKILADITKQLTLTSSYQVNGITNKAKELHISRKELIDSGWITDKEYTNASEIGLRLFKLYFKLDSAYIAEAKPELKLESADKKSKANLKAESLYDSEYEMEVDEGNEVEGSGIYYQQGANIRIQICSEVNCSDKKPYFNKIIYASDAGRVARLPFKNGAFQDNSFEAKFSDKGMLEYVKFSSSSSAEKAASTLNDVVDTYGDYKAKRSVYDKSEIDAAKAKAAEDEVKEITNLDQQIAILTKTQELEALNEQANAAIDKLKRELELKQLLKSIDDMTPSKAAEELARLQIEVEISKLLKELKALKVAD